MTARASFTQTETARLGRDLGPLATIPTNLRRAMYRLALQLQKVKK